ncbi:MAG: hydrolase [Sedimentisphaerales bacterium]|nr:hydrolase [Sedimentisphaerales bacterium]
MLRIQDCSLVVVDVQGKLAQLMYEKEPLFKNIQILIKAVKILQVPILWCQQCPEALGPTVPEIARLLSANEPINKASFSCWPNREFNDHLKSLSGNQVLICGIETHVCIYQTAIDLLQAGYEVNVVADAVSSRTIENKNIGLEKIKAAGAKFTSTEMVIFELLKTAEHPRFKEIVRLVK